MKTLHIVSTIGLLIFCISCKKDLTENGDYSATVNLVNAIASNDADIKMNFTGRNIAYYNARSLSYYNYDGKYVNGTLGFAIRVNEDIPLILTPMADTTQPFFNQTINLNNAESYSLFAVGSADAPSAFLIKDSLVSRMDSTGIRIINLSPNTDKVNVNIFWGDYSHQVSNLAFKDITSFIPFPVNISEPFYLAQVSNAVTNEVYYELFLDEMARQKNITLMVRGLLYGDPALEIVRLNH